MLNPWGDLARAVFCTDRDRSDHQVHAFETLYILFSPYKGCLKRDYIVTLPVVALLSSYGNIRN